MESGRLVGRCSGTGSNLRTQGNSNASTAEFGEFPVLPTNAVAIKSKMAQPEQLQSNQKDGEPASESRRPIRDLAVWAGRHRQRMDVHCCGSVLLVHASLALQAGETAPALAIQRNDSRASSRNFFRLPYAIRTHRGTKPSRGNAGVLSLSNVAQHYTVLLSLLAYYTGYHIADRILLLP
jgi:hypothetical protein